MQSEYAKPAFSESLPEPQVFGADAPGSRGRGWGTHYYPVEHSFDPFEYGFRMLWAGWAEWGPGDYWRRDEGRALGIEYVVSGSALVEQDGRVSEVLPGQVYLLHKGVPHCYATGPTGSLHKRFVAMDGPLVDYYLTLTDMRDRDVIPISAASPVVGMMRQACRLARLKPPGHGLELGLLAYRLLLELQLNLTQRYPSSVTAAIAFIQQNITRPVSNDDIARAAGVSASHVIALFNRLLHTTPLRLHDRMRMDSARYLLTHQRQSVKQTAAALGFDDPLYFSKHFRKRVGVSPRAYRRTDSHV